MVARSLVPAAIPGWFAALGLVLGACYALFLGPMRAPDEPGHMYRAYLVSEGICTGVPAIGYPADFHYLERFPWVQLSRNSTGRDLLNLVNDAQGRPLAFVSWFYAVNLYSCVPYLPSGAAFRLGRVFKAAPMTLMYLGRFANLIFYLGLTVVAMRLLPEFQLPLAILALMPMSLHQAAALSADAVTMALSFVMTAYVLRLALAEKPARLRRSDYLVLLAGVVVAGLCKSNAGLVFLLLLIPASKFPNRRTRWLAITGYIVLAFGTVAVWQYINRPNGEIYAALKSAAGIHLDENAAVIFRQPTRFLNVMGHLLVTMGPQYVDQFVGRLGWMDIRLPAWIPWLYPMLLVVAAAASRIEPRLFRWQRSLLIGIFLFNLASLLVAFWTTETPGEHLAENYIFGRYLIPFALLPLIAVSGVATRMRGRWIVVAALALVVLVNAVALNILWNHFQAHTSTFPNRIRMALRLRFTNTPENAAFLYEGQLVRRTGSSLEDSKVYLVRQGEKHWVTDARWIPSHGFEWPDDVHTIPPSYLAPIPEGAPIQ